ncbi:hypothetical protein PHMEG_00038958 [Phytophthora megakarya]|uniref:Uncharacterized protein n=1 Tax=Phytophthora megakarya TaxID=4795 RepID=A0A225UGP7_9STRA|nr:hypothetical protein PHMEG_00038958 [Phytophthora megakarya]
MLNQLTSIDERLARLEDAHASLVARGQVREPFAAQRTEDPSFSTTDAPLFAATPAQATATTLAGCLLNWYVSHIWQTVKGKREQNKRAEVKAAVNIMMVLYQMPFKVVAEPSKSDHIAYQAWKNALWELAVNMDTVANERLTKFDHKKPTRKPSSLRKRWRLLRTSHPDAYRSLGAQFLALQSRGCIIDACTPRSHLWTASDLQAPEPHRKHTHHRTRLKHNCPRLESNQRLEASLSLFR